MSAYIDVFHVCEVLCTVLCRMFIANSVNIVTFKNDILPNKKGSKVRLRDGKSY